MTFSRTALSLLDIVGVDDSIPVLANVLFRSDGTLVGANRKIVVVVSPMMKEASDVFPIQSDFENRGMEVAIPVASVREVAKSLTRDTKFGGLLEQFALIWNKPEEVTFKLNVGVSAKTITAAIFNRSYFNWKGVIQTAFQDTKSGCKCFANLKRLAGLIAMMSKACNDSSGELPVDIRVGTRTLLMRGQNPKTGQRILAVVNTYEVRDSSWLQETDWERGLTRKVVKMRREVR